MNNSAKIQQFRQISRQYSDASLLMHEAIARRAGLSGTDHKYLGLIMQKNEMTAGEISKITGLTTGAVTGLIDRLEKKKLVKRQFVKDDRRKVVVIPNTQKAMELLTPLFEELQHKTAKLVASFSNAEIRAIERYFMEAIAIMKATAEKLNRQ